MRISGQKAVVSTGTAEELIGQVESMLDQQQGEERKARSIARELRHDAVQDRIGAMRTAADFAFAAGVVQGVAQAASGACQGIGAADSLSAQPDAALGAGAEATSGATGGATASPGVENGAGLDAPPPQNQGLSSETLAKARMDAAERVQTEWGARGQMTQGVGAVGNAALTMISKGNDADAEVHQARAQEASDAAADANDAMQQTSQLRQKAMQHLETILQAQVDAQRAAIRG